jgi:hypothetical protein
VQFVLYTHIYYQLNAQYITLILLHVSATSHNHLQGVTVLEGTCKVFTQLVIHKWWYTIHHLRLKLHYMLHVSWSIVTAWSSWPKHVGASKTCIVHLVGNTFFIWTCCLHLQGRSRWVEDGWNYPNERCQNKESHNLHTHRRDKLWTRNSHHVNLQLNKTNQPATPPAVDYHMWVGSGALTF